MLASGPFKLNSRVIPSSFIPGLSYYYTSPPSTSSPSSRSPPLSLLLGWYASTPKQVSKYAQIYNGLGFNTISLTLPHEAVFGNQESTRKLRDAVAVELESIVNDRTIVPPSSPIVMQVFSNGGAFGLLHLTPSLTPSIFHSLKGVVYDSAPCYLHAVAGARALSYGITNRQGGRKMVEFALSPLFYIAGAFRTLVTGVDMREDYWTRLKDYPFKGPELYLYSNNDALCDVPKLEELIEERRNGKEEGVRMEGWNFKTSPHVLHYRIHKEDYMSKIKQFIKGLDM